MTSVNTLYVVTVVSVVVKKHDILYFRLAINDQPVRLY